MSEPSPLDKAFAALDVAAAELRLADRDMFALRAQVGRARARLNAAQNAYEAARWGCNALFDPDFNLLGRNYPNPPEWLQKADDPGSPE